jgi:hypothetical protein
MRQHETLTEEFDFGHFCLPYLILPKIKYLKGQGQITDFTAPHIRGQYSGKV